MEIAPTTRIRKKRSDDDRPKKRTRAVDTKKIDPETIEETVSKQEPLDEDVTMDVEKEVEKPITASTASNRLENTNLLIFSVYLKRDSNDYTLGIGRLMYDSNEMECDEMNAGGTSTLTQAEVTKMLGMIKRKMSGFFSQCRYRLTCDALSVPETVLYSSLDKAYGIAEYVVDVNEQFYMKMVWLNPLSEEVYDTEISSVSTKERGYLCVTKVSIEDQVCGFYISNNNDCDKASAIVFDKALSHLGITNHSVLKCETRFVSELLQHEVGKGRIPQVNIAKWD